MPIYEYQCQSCGHQLEKLQRMSDQPLTDCPDCGEEKLKRLVSAAAFRLKGAGWYETDFKKGNKKNLHGADSSAKPSDSDSAKPAAKADGAKSSDSKSSKKPENKSSSAKASTG